MPGAGLFMLSVKSKIPDKTRPYRYFLGYIIVLFGKNNFKKCLHILITYINNPTDNHRAGDISALLSTKLQINSLCLRCKS